MNSISCLLTSNQKVMPDDHSKLAPLLPIPNRTVKRLRADDSADSRVKVGHRQAPYPALAARLNQPSRFLFDRLGFLLCLLPCLTSQALLF